MQKSDRRTCTLVLLERGTYTISDGTGAYANASGSGTYTLVVDGVGCDRSKPPTVLSVVIQAHGPLAL